MAVFQDLGQTQVTVREHVLSCLTTTGRRYTVAFPYSIEQLHPLQDGLIVQCTAGARFHHDQVLGQPREQLQRFTFFTIVGHPYNDIYTLGALGGHCWTKSSAKVVKSSPRFPLLFAYFPEERMHRLLVLRVNRELIDREKTSLESLNPAKRDEAMFRQTSSEHYLVTDEAVAFPSMAEEVEKVEFYAGASGDCLFIAVLQKGDLALGRFAPARTWTEGPKIDGVRGFTLLDRDAHPETIRSETPPALDDLHAEFQRLIAQSCQHLVLLKNDNSLQLIDGTDFVCSFSISELFPSVTAAAQEVSGGDKLQVVFEGGLQREVIRPFEFRNTLVRKCLGALYAVLPLSLYHSIFADLMRRVVAARVKGEEERTDQRAVDKSSEFCQFCTLILALVKENNRDASSQKRAKVEYTDEVLGDWSTEWDRLLSSRFHNVESDRFAGLFADSPKAKRKRKMGGYPTLDLTSSPGALVRNLPAILHALHLLYEDLKLSLFTRRYCKELAPFLCSIARLLCPGGRAYEHFYQRDFPDLAIDLAEDSLGSPLEARVPSVHDWMLSIVLDEPPAYFPVMFETTRKVCLLFECLSSMPKSSGPSPFAQRRSTEMSEFSEAEERTFPLFENSPERQRGSIKAASPFERFLRTLVEEKVTEATLQSLPLSVRLPALEILRTLSQTPPDSSRTWPRSALELMNRPDIYLTFRREKPSKPGYIAKHSIDQHYEQMLRLELLSEELKSTASIVLQVYPADLRFEEADSLLNVSRPMKMKVPEYIVSEDQLEGEKQTLLYRLCVRRAATCVGYGALHLGTRKATPTDSNSIPGIALAALIPPNFDTKMTLSNEELNNRDKDFLIWPSFHIGVASALKIYSENPSDYIKDRQWINFHKMESGTHEHAGFLLGLGLLGQLDSLDRFDIYKYVEPRQPPFEIAMYLGRAASTIGSMDRMMMGVLSLSLSFLFPPSRDGKVHLPCEAASMMGFGLLYRNSANREVTEILLVQMDRKAISNSDIEKESLNLCAGLALGMVNLALGSSAPGLEDLNLDERLIRMFEGGKRLPPPKLLKAYPLVTDPVNCSVVHEGDIVNTSVTAPGALLAYSLIHLRSNNALAAAQIQMPTTQFLLDYIKPEHALLKILAKNLIMWDDIQPTSKWLHGEIPDIISHCFENDLKACRAKYTESYSSLDFSTIANCYVYCLAGGLLSLAFRYLGSCDAEVAQVIVSEVLALRKLKVQVLGTGGDYNDSNKNNIERQTWLTFLCVGALSASLVMAGTGDIETFKFLKRIRKLVETDGGYGGSMAVHMAIGFLFLGAGQYSFSNSDFAIAALLCSVYPKFPVSSADNRYHLQPLRHFYALALEKRLLVTVDADTRQVVHARAEVTNSSGAVDIVTTPVLLKPLSSLRKIVITDSEFFPVTVDFTGQMKLKVYLKRKGWKIENGLDSPLDRFVKLVNAAEVDSLGEFLGAIGVREHSDLRSAVQAFECRAKSLWEQCFREQRTEILPFLMLTDKLQSTDSPLGDVTAEELREVIELYTCRFLSRVAQSPTTALILSSEEVETARFRALSRFNLPLQEMQPERLAEFRRFNRILRDEAGGNLSTFEGVVLTEGKI